MPEPPLSPAAATVRRHDPDRFLTALFAPAVHREPLFLLYAFNHELARAREIASQPTLALIRLQWWREVVEGAVRRHELATPLGEALAAGRLDRGELLTMIAGREVEADESVPTRAEWRLFIHSSAGALAAAAARALGGDGAVVERVRALGAAYGVAGQLRSIGLLARYGRCQLPEDVLAEHGLTTHAVLATPDAPAVRSVRDVLAADGQSWIDAGRGRFPAGEVAAALPGVLARRDLARLDAPLRPRGVGDRLAVITAAMRRRV
ncbi:MAG TPA: squalene/phytoene synthase family protein [Acetobacteraceae bacterium]|jgi:phytoene synthase|nr:squalene/phytoene synthase family protein [Acetobacteraceae bacterium]